MAKKGIAAAARRFMTKHRVTIAWILFWASLLGWPLSLIFTDEPPFILSLSWLALTLTSWDVIQTSELHDD